MAILSTMDSLAIIIAEKVAHLTLGESVAKWLHHLRDPNTPRFLEAREEMFRGWVVELVN
jgi:hypothetical protein